MVAGRLDHVADAIRAADIAGVDPQAGGARLGRLDGALVVEVDVGDDRHVDIAHDLLQRDRAFLVRHRDADDVGAGRRRSG